MQRDYRILQGFQGNAGQPGLLARELSEQGVLSKSALIGRNKFNYACDYWIEDHSRNAVRKFLAEEATRFDIIHVHAITPFYTKRQLAYPMGTDLLALKAAGKRIVIHFRGSEVRLRSLFAERSPYHYVDEDPGGMISKFPEAAQIDYIAMCRALADEIIVSDPELQSYVPGARILPRGMDLRRWHRPADPKNAKPLVLHAPSRQGVKGTSHVLAAVKKLEDEGVPFDFQLVQGLPNAKAKALYESADIIVDQLRIGWYGVLSTEAMALGKAVVAYIRDDIVHTLGDKLPLANANPDNITDVLRGLILDRHLREETAERGYRFCHSVHDSRVVAKEAINIYDEVMAAPARFDFAGYMAINSKQERAADEALFAAKVAGKNAGKKAVYARMAALPLPVAKKRDVGAAVRSAVGKLRFFK
jgi:glycosyltransferase involved in cell wall biosynthesis